MRVFVLFVYASLKVGEFVPSPGFRDRKTHDFLESGRPLIWAITSTASLYKEMEEGTYVLYLVALALLTHAFLYWH